MPDEKDRRLDEWLDDGLQQYGQAEPRFGLEDRVLASVRAERERRDTRQWRWWPALATVTAMIVVGTFFGIRSQQRTSPSVARTQATPGQEMPEAPSQAEIARRPTGQARVSSRRGWHEPVQAAGARQEQFPSPQPLSEQEKILARYVLHFPQQASLMAQAQIEFRSEQMSDSLGSEIPPDTEQQNQ